MANVLLIGINYAPELTGTGMNNTAMARQLREEGHSVEVLTGVPHYPEWRVHSAYRRRFRMTENLHGVTVRRFAHYVPHHHSAMSRALYELTFTINVCASWPLRRPDVVLGVTPALGGAVLARLFAARYKAVWGIVFADLTGRAAMQSGLPGGRRVAGLAASVELSAARAATEVAVIAEGFRGYLEDGGVAASRIQRIVNSDQLHPSDLPHDRALIRRQLGWSERDFVILHTGNIGYKQALENVVHTAALARGRGTYRFELFGDGNCRRELEKLAGKLGVLNLRFRQLAPAAQYAAVLDAADVLLLNQRASVTDMSLPGKLANYLSSSTPVIAAVADNSVTALEVTGLEGVTVISPEDPAALLKAIDAVATEEPRANEFDGRGRAFESKRVASASQHDISRFVDRLLSASHRAQPAGP